MLEISTWYPTYRVNVKTPGVTGSGLREKVKIEFIIPKRPFLIWWRPTDGVMIPYPKGFGVAYRSSVTLDILLAPMPFNVVIGGLIWAYEWVRFGFAHWLWEHKSSVSLRYGKKDV